MDTLEAKEMLKLKRSILESTQLLRERRAAILAGASLTEEEAALPPLEDEEVPDVLAPSLDAYWRCAIESALDGHDLKTCEMHSVPTDADLDILTYLADLNFKIEAAAQGEACGAGEAREHAGDHEAHDVLTLQLVFRANEYLMPGCETLEVVFLRTDGVIQSTEGHPIHWQEGRAPDMTTALSFFSIFEAVASFDEPQTMTSGSGDRAVKVDPDVTTELLALLEDAVVPCATALALEEPAGEEEYEGSGEIGGEIGGEMIAEQHWCRRSTPTQPYVIGLTGGIAAGKSTARKMLVQMGIEMAETLGGAAGGLGGSNGAGSSSGSATHSLVDALDCDLLAHEAYAPGTAAFAQLVGEFGDGIVTSDGLIDRQMLGARVFGATDGGVAMRKLTDIVWPATAEMATARIAGARLWSKPHAVHVRPMHVHAHDLRMCLLTVWQALLHLSWSWRQLFYSRRDGTRWWTRFGW